MIAEGLDTLKNMAHDMNEVSCIVTVVCWQVVVVVVVVWPLTAEVRSVTSI